MGRRVTETALAMRQSSWSLGGSASGSLASESHESAQYRGAQNSSRALPVRVADSIARLGCSNQLEEKESESRAAFDPARSVLSSDHRAREPAFDRISACKTNYDLSNGAALSVRSQYGTSAARGLQAPGAAYFGRQRSEAAARQHSRSDLGYNFAGVAFDGRHVPAPQVGDKKCFDRPPARDPPGLAYNIVDGRMQPTTLLP